MSVKLGKSVLLHEAEAITAMASQLGSDFKKAVDLMSSTRKPVILVGMGKPAFIADKISASMASTGTASFTLHPADALHGDLGRIHKNAVVILLSNSGETEEIIRLVPLLKTLKCRLIAITGNVRSYLAKYSNAVLDTSVVSEAKPLGVAPTTSTTCMLAMGDALTMALVEKKGFKKEDFALLHPGGSLGKKLRLTVRDVMRSGSKHAKVSHSASLKSVLLAITKARAGSATVVNSKKECLGIFTDGDLRRHIEKRGASLNIAVSKVMTASPTTVKDTELVSDVVAVVRNHKIDEVPVVNGRGRVVGVLDIQDLLDKGF